MTLPRRPGPSSRVRVREITGSRFREREDRLATEGPLEIRLAWTGRRAERLSVTMRTRIALTAHSRASRSSTW